jgi:hypothetical protein
MKTAVVFLVEYITSDGGFDLQAVIKQAKEMEQEQLAKSYNKGSSDAVDDLWEFMNPND